MIAFGPVAEAAHGGRSSPSFDLLVGLVVLVMTWVGYRQKKDKNTSAIWIAISISILCGVFIFDGLRLMLR